MCCYRLITAQRKISVRVLVSQLENFLHYT